MKRIFFRAANALRLLLRKTMFALRRLGHRLWSENLEIGHGARLDRGVRIRISDGGRVLIGRRCYIGRDVAITAQGAVIRIGADGFVGDWCTIAAKSGISIGEDCLIAERVTIRDQDHDIDSHSDAPIRAAGYRAKNVEIGADVWLGAGAVVLKGATVADGAVVAANAVVTSDIPAAAVAAGVPAKLIRFRRPT